MPATYEILIIAAMLLLNAFFAAFEMALASISQARLLVLVDEKRAGAASALALKERMGASLAVIQVGMTLAGALAAATGGAGVQETLTPRLEGLRHISHPVAQTLSVLIVVVPLSALTIVFGELVPKVFAIENKERVCLGLAPLMRIFAWVISPVANFLESCVKTALKLERFFLEGKAEDLEAIPGFHELAAAAALARTKRLLGAREERIVLSAAQLSRRRIGDIVLPASEISLIPSQASLADALVRTHLDLHTRFPIASEENNPQSIEGYLTFKDLVTALKMQAAAPTVKEIARPIKRIAAETPIAQVLEQMMKEKVHIALVVSKEDKVLGMITLEDIIEELVGDIEDEQDSLPSHMHATAGGWIMGGGAPMHAVASRLGVSWSPGLAKASSDKAESTLHLADWCESALGRPLKKGETFRADGLQISVRKLRRRKLAEAFVSKAAVS